MLYNYNWEEQRNSIFSTIENLLYRGLEDIREKHNNKNKHIDDKKYIVVQRKENKEKLIKQLTDVVSRINDQLDIESQDKIIAELQLIQKKAIQ